MSDGLPESGDTKGGNHSWNARWVYLAAGFSGIIIAIGYIFITSAYVKSGTPLPTEGEAWITYLTGKSITWWLIICLSIFTDLLYLPVALGLYIVLRRINNGMMLLSSTLFILFVLLDLSITWPNYAVMIEFTDGYNSAATEAERGIYLTSIEYASAMFETPILAFYAIFVPALAAIAACLVMLRSNEFKKYVAYIGLASGILSAFSVIGGLFSDTMSSLVIPASILILVWFFLIGIRFLKMGRENNLQV